MQVAKDLPAKLITEVIKSKEKGETTQDSMVNLISKAIKVLANPTRKDIFLECLGSPKEFDKNSLILYHLRMLENYGIINYTSKGYTPTNFAIELWNSIDKLEIIPSSALSIKILLSLTSKSKTFIEFKKNLKVNEGSVFRALNFLLMNKLIIKEANYYSLAPMTDISKLETLISRYTDLIKDASYDENLQSITMPKEKETEILDLFDREKKIVKGKLWREEDLIKDHIVISYSYNSRSEIDEIINSILKEQSGLINSRYVKPLYTFEKNMIRFAYDTRYVTRLQTLLSLLALHDIPILDALMVEDVNFPKKFIKNFKGPKFGREGIRKLLKVENRPILQAVFLPEENLDIQNIKKLSRRLFTAGIDEMCDHRIIVEDLKNFRKRVEVITQTIDEIKNDIGQKIYYFLIYGEDYEERIDILKEMQSKCIGIGLAPFTLGFPLTYNITKKYDYPTIFGLILQTPFTHYAKRGISKEGEFLSGFGINMNIFLKFFVLLGGDEIHTDPLYPSYEEWKIRIQRDILNYYFKELKKPFPVLIGGINSISIPSVIKNYGKDIVLKFTTTKLTKAEKLGFSIERSINAFKQAIEIATSEEKEITIDKYKDYMDSIKFYKKF